jgi:AcrR family transcriptional regulator
MSARAAGAELTRERIVEAARDAFLERWYDDVTLRGIAEEAGVALQTVVNHFGTKEALFGVALDRINDEILSVRAPAEAGDLDGAVATVVDNYDRTGDFTLRLLALEDRAPVLEPALERGRRLHQEWVERVFAAALTGLRGAVRKRRVAQLVVVTDVYTWKLLRRDKGLSRDQTIVALRELVEALHHHPEGETE